MFKLYIFLLIARTQYELGICIDYVNDYVTVAHERVYWPIMSIPNDKCSFIIDKNGDFSV